MTQREEPANNRSSRPHSTTARIVPLAWIAVALAIVAFARSPQPLAAKNADPTFAEDVAPILYKNCTVCHHIGGIGPMPLFEYDSAKAYIDEIREKITLGKMPPWHATGPRGVFRNDRRLSDADRATIIRWLDAGAKPGDLKKLPPRPTYTDWSIGKPDAQFAMPTEFTVPAKGTIAYQDFEVPTDFTEDKWVTAYEIMPGSREVVHHVQVYARMPPAPPRPPGSPPFRPALQRNPTYEPVTPPKPRGLFARIFEDPPKNRGTLIASMAPGTNAIDFPKGTALKLRKGTVLTFVMHYTAHGHEMKDRTTIGFKFAKEPPTEEIYAGQFVNEVFTIPAGAKDVQVPAEIGAKEPIKVWGLLPHTHVRGTRWLYKYVKPDGTSETLLDIPQYDFNWQTYYLFAKPLEMPIGSKITSVAWYDNSPGNKSNPDPKKVVREGQQTWDEMQYTGFLFSVPSWDLAQGKK